MTKYVYGLGLIGEECGGAFKTYHFDYRGSTVAITDASGNITDAFRYDTYGRMTEHVGDSEVIFGYNGRDGVVTDKNGLIYMRARYYSPKLRRFVNADIVAGKISNAITLNRYAYANGNPVSNIDPFGLSAMIVPFWARKEVKPGSPGIIEKIIKIYNNVKTWAEKKADEAQDSAKKGFKKIENNLLKAEAKLNLNSSSYAAANYDNNKKIDMTNSYVYGQSTAGMENFKLGDQSFPKNGCEVAAVNNAMNLLGYDTSLAGIIRTFEEEGAVVGGTLIDGYFGSNPYSLPDVFDAYDLSYETVTFSEINKEGIYIVSFWCSDEYGSTLHTVAIQYHNGTYTIYNYFNNATEPSPYSSLPNDISNYITGYYLGNNTSNNRK